MNSEVSDKVIDVCVNLLKLNPKSVRLESRLIHDLDMDSLFASELALALEKQFKIEVSDETMAKFVTIADIVDYVDSALKK